MLRSLFWVHYLKTLEFSFVFFFLFCDKCVWEGNGWGLCIWYIVGILLGFGFGFGFELAVVQTKNELKISKFISFHFTLRPTDTVERSILTWDWSELDSKTTMERRERHYASSASISNNCTSPPSGWLRAF